MTKKVEPLFGIKLWQVLLGLAGSAIFIFSFAYQQISADVNQGRDITEYGEKLEEVEATLETHDQDIEQTERQYMMIQQSLGGIQEALKEMKGRR